MKTTVRLSLYCLLALCGLAFLPLKAETVLWSENFDDGNGDSRWYPDNGTGGWQMGVPTSGPGAAHSGTNCAATVLDGNYPLGANARLIRISSFPVPAASEFPRLRFWHWYSFGCSSGCYGCSGCDYGVVEIKGTNGSWQAVSPGYSGSGGDWTYASVDLSAYAGQTVQVAFHIVTATTCCQHTAAGWYVDDVALISGTPTFNNPEGWENGMGDWYAETGSWQVGVPTSGPGTAGNFNAMQGFGWTFGASAGIDHNSGTWHSAAAPEGSQAAFIQYANGAASSIQQPLSFPAVGAYTVSFSCIGRPGYGPNTIQVQVDGITIYNLSYTNQSQTAWQAFNAAFICTNAGVHTLAFVGARTGGDFASCLDAVSVSGPAPLTVLNPGFETPGISGYAYENPAGAHSGKNCAATILGGNYPGGANSRLVSPAFTVPPANQLPRLRFWHWYSFGCSSGCYGCSGCDYGVVEIKGTNGSWQAVSPGYSGSGGDWTYASVDLSAYAGQTVQLAFHIVTATTCCQHTAAGWYVNDVALISGTPTFNNPEGWENGMGDWYAETGSWQVGVPTSGPGGAYAGTNCAATILNGNYPGGVDSRLISPVVLIPPAASGPYLRFWQWYSFGCSSGCYGCSGCDYGVVEVNNGTNGWASLSQQYTGSSGGIWSHPYFDLTAYGGQAVRFAFHMATATTCCQHTAAGWYIDDLSINASPYPPTIIQAPTSLVITQGQTAQLSAWADGSAPLSYQWSFGGTNLLDGGRINGSSSLNLVISNVLPADQGTYTFTVSNSVSSLSTNATLTVIIPRAAAIVSPGGGSVFTAPVNIPINATASDPDGPIGKVVLLAGSNSLATLTSAPYTFVWTNAPVGSYVLTAIATDHAGLGITSAPVNITVQPSVPQIAISSPTNGAILISPASTEIGALALDADNAISRIEFYAQSASAPAPVLLTSFTNPPYVYDWNHIQPGTYQITAHAVSSYGPVGVSAPVTLKVLQPATLQFSTNQYFVNESNGAVVVTVLNSGDLAGVASYQTADGTAHGGTGFSGDYVIAAGSLALGGHQATNVSIGIIDNYLNQPDISFQMQLLFPGLGVVLGHPATNTVTIHMNDSGDATNSLLSTHSPVGLSGASGALAVVTTPAEAQGEWRLPWEQSWRTNGDTVSNLLAGTYSIEFRNTSGYLAYPPSLSVTVTNGGLAELTNQYYPTAGIFGHLDPGSLTVGTGTNSPASTNATVSSGLPAGAGWRFIGETAWRSPGSTASNLIPDTFFIEFAPVSGWYKPASQAVLVSSDANIFELGTYLLPQVPPASAVAFPTNVPTDELTNYAGYPFGFVGQLLTDNGYGSGVAVRPNVVLTAAHLIYSDVTHDYVKQAYWFPQQTTNSHSVPIKARGWYALSGYAQQRNNDVGSGLYGPGDSSPESRNLDVAALYFVTPAAGGGFNGYLVSDASPNPYLAGSNLKMLAGYPIDGTLFGDASIVPGQMYQTIPRTDPFSQATDVVSGQQRVYTAPWLLSYSGNSGGPVFVQVNGYYYPAAVYLGTLYSGDQPYASAVRVIDSSVTALINLAASGGDSGTNNNAGGVITVTVPQSVGAEAFVRVNLGPPDALAAGGGCRIAGTNANASYFSVSNFAAVFPTPAPITVQFKPIPGWTKPEDLTVIPSLGQITATNVLYSPAPAQLDVEPAGTISFSGAAHGPFLPPSQSCAISNAGQGTLNWTVSADQNWLTINPTNGQGAALVAISVNTNANTLTNGTYTGNLTFGGNGGETVRMVQLKVTNTSPDMSTLALTVYPPGAGTVIGGGTFKTGSARAATARAIPGYKFTDWTSDGMVITNTPTYTFTLAESVSLVANFADIAKPTIKIAAPTPNLSVSNAAYTVKGTARDNAVVSNVFYQLNSAAWAIADTSNGWSNWTADVTFVPGPNTIRAYAQDTSGNLSATNAVIIQYILKVPVTVEKVGRGTVAPNYSGQSLALGYRYSMIAAAAPGFSFAGWTGSAVSNSVKLTFLTVSNLDFVANFRDIARPVNIITFPVLNHTVTNSPFIGAGKANDNVGVASVWCQLDGLDWFAAATDNTYTNWTTLSSGATPLQGINQISAFAMDAAGNRSLTNTVTFSYNVTPAADWAPDSLNGLMAEIVADAGSPESLSFDVTTFAQSGAADDTNLNDSGVGYYAYAKTDTNAAQLTLAATAPVTNAPSIISLLFTNHYGGVFTNSASGDSGNISFVIATNLLPLPVAGKTLTGVETGTGATNKVRFVNGVGFVMTPASEGETNSGSGIYTMARFSPIAGLFQFAFTNPADAGKVTYLQATFTNRAGGMYFRANFDALGALENTQTGRLLLK